MASGSAQNKINSPIIKSVIIGLISSALYFVIIALFTAFSLKSGVSPSAYMPAGLVIGGVTGLLCGFISGKINKEKGLIFGAVGGTAQAAVIAAILFFVNSGNIGAGLLILCAVIVASSVAGGIAAVNFNIKKKYK